MTRWTGVVSIAVAAFGFACNAADDKKPERVFTDAKKAGRDFALQGEYDGEMTLNRGKVKLGAQVIADGDGKFTVRLLPGGLPGDGGDGKVMAECKADTKDGVTLITGVTVSDVIKKDGDIVGVKTTEGDELLADVIIACDGANSILAQKAGLHREWKPEDGLA